MHHGDRPNLTAKVSLSEEPAPGRAEYSGVVSTGKVTRTAAARLWQSRRGAGDRPGNSTCDCRCAGRVRAEIAARDIKRGAIAAELGLTGDTLNRILAKLPRVPGLSTIGK